MGTLYTSLNEILSFDPCRAGWHDVLAGQQKERADDVLFPLIDCLKSNSVSNVLWLLGKRNKEIGICVKFAFDCAESAAHLEGNKLELERALAVLDTYETDCQYDRAIGFGFSIEAAVVAHEIAVIAAKIAEAECREEEQIAKYWAAKWRQYEKNKQLLVKCIREYESQT